MEIMESPASPPLKRARLLPPASDGGALRRRAAPLVVAAVYDAANLSRVDVRLVDVSSGAVVARLDGLSSGHFAAAGGLVCLVGASGDSAAVRVLDPATGAATDIITAPADAAATHGHQRPSPPPSHVFGQVPATGEYKVLRIHAAGGQPHHSQQACEILTLGERRWRPAPSPPAPVAAATHRTRAVVRGVAHFLPAPPPLFHPHHSHHAAKCDAVASFDLGAETWRPALLRGALCSSGAGAGGAGGGRVHRAHLSLAELDGCLATVHHNYGGGGTIDVWRLPDDMEAEGRTWTRTHSLRLGSVLCGMGQVVAAGEWESLAQPLAVLGDGRVAVWVEGKGSVRVYDPRTEACVEVADMGRFSCVIGLYTGAMAVNGDKAFSNG